MIINIVYFFLLFYFFGLLLIGRCLMLIVLRFFIVCFLEFFDGLVWLGGWFIILLFLGGYVLMDCIWVSVLDNWEFWCLRLVCFWEGDNGWEGLLGEVVLVMVLGFWFWFFYIVNGF